MNNRGKPLSHLELLKNRLIYLSTKFNVEDYEKNDLRTAINECWKSIYHYLGKNKDKPLDDDFFLRSHFLLYFGREFFSYDEHSLRPYRAVRRFYSNEYKDFLLENYFNVRNIEGFLHDSEKRPKLTIMDVYKYSQNLKQSVEFWYKILNPVDSDLTDDEKQWLEKLNRLGIEYAAPLVMAFFQKESRLRARVDFLKVVERLIFLQYLVRYKGFLDIGVHELIDHASRISAGHTETDKLVKDLKGAVDSAKTNRELWVQIEKNFRNGGFYEWAGIKYFLYEYDLYLKSKSRTRREKIVWEQFVEDLDDYQAVEHVYPQRPRKPCWTNTFDRFSADEKKKLRHSLGNLVPLSQAKNSSFSNKCFDDKKGNEENKVGFRYGSYAENEIAFRELWTANEILERGIKLLSFLEDRWDIQIGDKGKKVRMLGLEFVEHAKDVKARPMAGRVASRSVKPGKSGSGEG